jgi:hypothetical protein
VVGVSAVGVTGDVALLCSTGGSAAVAAEIEESAGRRECGCPGSARVPTSTQPIGAPWPHCAPCPSDLGHGGTPGSASVVLRSLVSGESGETEGLHSASVNLEGRLISNDQRR